MKLDPHVPELTVEEAGRCFMSPAEVWDLAVRRDLGLREGGRFLNNVSDGRFIPFLKSGKATTSPRLYSALSAVMLRTMWEVTRSGRTYGFAARIAQEAELVARDIIEQSSDIHAVDEEDWFIIYRTNLAGQPDRISRVTKDQIAADLSMGSYDIGLVRAGAIVVNVLRHYSGFWEKERRARGLSKLPARYHGVDDLGLPLDPDHKIYLKLPPLELAKRRVMIEEFIERREAEEQKGKG